MGRVKGTHFFFFFKEPAEQGLVPSSRTSTTNRPQDPIGRPSPHAGICGCRFGLGPTAPRPRLRHTGRRRPNPRILHGIDAGGGRIGGVRLRRRSMRVGDGVERRTRPAEPLRLADARPGPARN